MQLNIPEIREIIANESLDSKIYIGCDSERFLHKNKWYADYSTVVVIHINGKNGARVFGNVTRELDYDMKLSKPSMRLMNEVYKVSELYSNLKDVIANRYCEIHLDINPNDRYGSSCIVTQAIGYILGTCGVKPKLKPNAMAASIAADRFKELIA
jgi:predicted RNase H-related nuclease YkuK (DUF458 family)